MPTAKHRVTVNLEPDKFAVLNALANRQGISMSSVLAELWDMAAPVMSRVVDLLEQAELVEQSAKGRIRRIAAQTAAEMEPMVAAVLHNYDLFAEQIQQAIDDKHAAADAAPGTGAARRRRPPASNTGVRFGKPL